MTLRSTGAPGTLRVLMIAPTSFFADYGCHVRILEEIRALSELGHRVVVCTYHNGDDVAGIEIRRSVDVPWRKRVIVGSSRHKLYLDAVLSFETLRTAIHFKPDVIHAHLHEGALIGGVLAKLLRRPLVFDYQGSLTEEMIDHGFLRSGGCVQPILRRVEQIIDAIPSVIVTSSKNARYRLEARGVAGQIRTVLDAVDTARFSPHSVSADERASLRRDLDIPSGSPVVAYLGLLAPYQGTDLLLDAAKTIIERAPDTYFLLMGYPGVERYREKAHEIGILDRVRFPGRIPYASAHRFLALGDIALAPKMSLTEGNGKIYNYMSMGLPVVAFDAPANQEILGEFGVYARLGDADDFATQVLDLLSNRPKAASIGRLLRARAERHLSWSNRVNELLAVYNSVLPLDRSVVIPRAPTAPAPGFSVRASFDARAHLEVGTHSDTADN